MTVIAPTSLSSGGVFNATLTVAILGVGGGAIDTSAKLVYPDPALVIVNFVTSPDTELYSAVPSAKSPGISDGRIHWCPSQFHILVL